MQELYDHIKALQDSIEKKEDLAFLKKHALAIRKLCLQVTQEFLPKPDFEFQPFTRRDITNRIEVVKNGTEEFLEKSDQLNDEKKVVTARIMRTTLERAAEIANVTLK